MNPPPPPEPPEQARHIPSWLDPDKVAARGERNLAVLEKLAEMGLANTICAARAAQDPSSELEAARANRAFVASGRFTAWCATEESRLAARLRADARREAAEDHGPRRRLPDPVLLLARRQLRDWAAKTPALESLAETRKDIEERLQDPDIQTILRRGLPACRIVAVVAEDLGIEVDWKKIPDEVMGIEWTKAGTRRYPQEDPKCQGGPFGYPKPEPPGAG